MMSNPTKPLNPQFIHSDSGFVAPDFHSASHILPRGYALAASLQTNQERAIDVRTRLDGWIPCRLPVLVLAPGWPLLLVIAGVICRAQRCCFAAHGHGHGARCSL
jgi:hypothetical protein